MSTVQRPGALHRLQRIVHPLFGCFPLDGAVGGTWFVHSADWPTSAATTYGTRADGAPSPALVLLTSPQQMREREKGGGQQASRV